MSRTRTVREVVGVFDNKYRQLFSHAVIMKATTNPDSEFMKHPLETGSQITDHRYLKQIQIELTIMLEAQYYKNTYREIFQLWASGVPLTVRTKGKTFTNQVIKSIPSEEDPAHFDAISMMVKLEQVQFANTNITLSPLSSADKGVVQRGELQPITIGSGNQLRGYLR